MTLLLTGITNENEFYTNYYLSEVLENDLKEIGARWKDESDKTGEKAPPDELRGYANDYFRFKNSLSKDSNADGRLAQQREFSQALLKILGYNQSPRDLVLEDGSAVPILCEVSKTSGEPELWILEAFSVTDSDDGSADPLGLCFSRNQFQPSEEPTEHKLLLDQPIEDLISKTIFSQAEPPRWVVVVSDSQLLLIDRTKWNDQRLLRFDIEEILARRDASTLAATCTLLHRDSITSTQGQPLLDTLDEKSHKHAQTVTKDLKYALQKSIEIIGNEAINSLRASKEKIFERDIEKQLSFECLQFMYRLLFILYIEAREELGYAPMKSDAYRQGYSFESLRDLEVIELTTEESRQGFYIHDSIKLLFDVIYRGYPEYQAEKEEPQLLLSLPPSSRTRSTENVQSFGFELFPLRSHLFDPAKTPLLNKVRLRNAEMLQVLKLMSLSKSKGSKQRSGRISYAQLGINQLGAVYEALLCFNGFFAEQDLFEVQPAPKKAAKADEDTDDETDFEAENAGTAQTPRKGKGKTEVRNTRDELEIAYLVPLEELEKYSIDERVFDQDGKQKKYDKGKFIYRLAGRDRQKSASYYTPEVLTKCLVKYSLKELLKDKSADDILKLKVCEPAMGSAAFLNECVNQLADAYLERKQAELDRRIAHDEYTWEKQRVKMFIADRNVFGVDLNPVAVQLAEVSLWLNSIYEGAFVPWFGMQLVCGNSLVGARRQVYPSALLSKSQSGAKLWFETAPHRITPGQVRDKDNIYHFLLPDPAMSKYDDKVVKDLAQEDIQRIDSWRAKFAAPLESSEIKQVLELSKKVDLLWQAHSAKLREIRETTTDPLSVFGHKDDIEKALTSTEQKDSLFGQEGLMAEALSSSAYCALKLIMDYWCALWFWPILQSKELPTRAEYLADLALVLSGTDGSKAEKPARLEALVDGSERLQVVRALSERYRFLHWELEFADIFDHDGGFDLVIGNPPWIKLEWQEAGVLGDHEPAFVVKKISASDTAKLRKDTIEKYQMLPEYLAAFEENSATQGFLNAMQNYPLLKGVQSNSFKCFLPQGWMIANKDGVISYVHPEGVYDDPKGGALRKALYSRLRYHFQHQNQLILFPIGHREKYSLNIYSNQKSDQFYSISNLFHPKTIDLCFQHDGSGQVPGIKDDNNKWDFSGHRERIIAADQSTLSLFATLYDAPGTSASEARLPALHSQSLVEVLQSFATQKSELANFGPNLISSEFWHETNSQKDGTIRRETKFVDSPEELIYSGPHFHIGNPFWKTPRRVCTEKGHYDVVDLTSITDDYLPRTNYLPACSSAEYHRRSPDAWDGSKVTDYFRLVSRNMLSPAMERTLISAIIPPGVAHIHTVFALVFKQTIDLIDAAAMFFSVPVDFCIKSTGKSHFYFELAGRLPLPTCSAELASHRRVRVLSLSCLTRPYGELWSESWSDNFNEAAAQTQLGRNYTRPVLGEVWQPSFALRDSLSRRNALLELDVLTALSMDISLKDLLSLYRIQFPVMQQYERETFYDQDGRIVFTANKGLPGVGLTRKEWESVKQMSRGTHESTIEDDTQPSGPIQRTITYHAPFFSMNREQDYEVAWKEFSQRLGTKHNVAVTKDEKISSII